jgi:hypothetical protein
VIFSTCSKTQQQGSNSQNLSRPFDVPYRRANTLVARFSDSTFRTSKRQVLLRAQRDKKIT